MKILQFSMNDFSFFSDVYSGEAIKRFAEEMKKQRDVILFIDEIHLLGRYKYFTDTLKWGDPKKLDFIPETFRNICLWFFVLKISLKRNRS